MSDTITTILIALLGSGLIQFFFNRHDSKKGLPNEVHELRVSVCRLQLLILISDYPSNVSEIMKVAEKYFAVFKGDWYMTSIFNKWLKEKKIGKPEWFDPKK